MWKTTAVGLVMLAGLAVTGCATEDYVNKHVATCRVR